LTGLAAALLGLCLATGVATAARPLEAYKHVSWPIDGGAPGRNNALAQSADGYVWIGGVEGLVRFDGVQFEPIAPPPLWTGRMVVSALYAGAQGELWVGLARSKGLLVYRDGRLADAGMPNPSREVNDIAIDGAGVVWVARGGRTRDALARYADGAWQEIGVDWGLPAQQVWRLLVARDGALWVVLADTVVTLAPGGQRFAPTGIATTPRAGIAEDSQGRIWIADANGARIVHGGSGGAAPDAALKAPATNTGGARILFDGDGGLWAATYNAGLFHVAEPLAGSGASGFGAAAGLTSDQTRGLLRDREGNIWVGTELGLDMFRPASVAIEPAIAANSPSTYRIAAGTGGTVYVGDAAHLYAIAPGGSPGIVMALDSPAEALCAARDDAVWVALADRLVRTGGPVSTSVPKPPGTTAYGCVEDPQGRLWMPALDDGLYVWTQGAWTQIAGQDGAAARPADVTLDPGGTPAVLFRSAPADHDERSFLPVYREMFHIGGLEGLLGTKDALFVGGAEGLARIQGGKTAELRADSSPWLASINGIAQSPAGDTWMIGDSGVIRLRTGDLARAFDTQDPAIPHRIFDYRDGLNSFVQKGPGAQIAVGGDGRVWFATRGNIARIDPARLVRNEAAPPVRIRAIAGRAREGFAGDRVELEAGVSSVSIAYTALTFTAPSRVRFKYRLEGVDSDWVDGGARRSVQYAGLGPGTFRFRVIAMNDDGVWNEAGDSATIYIPPTLWEQRWLQVASAALLAGLVWLGFKWRVRAATSAVEQRLSERQAERIRIARELHDTLIQGFQGLLVRFQVVSNAIPKDEKARALMEQALDRADEILIEGRDRVRDLRSNEDTSAPIIEQLRRFAYELETGGSAPIEVKCSGVLRPLNLDAQREMFAIAREALANAARHAGASAIECEIAYSPPRVVLTCRDNGMGIDPMLLRKGGKEGHWGLQGMMERAKHLGASLAIQSGPTGTVIRLTVKARVAYGRTSRLRES
jgi:signal transduction histidine kinase/ligand-binding sensor domain-containing protein